MIDASFGPALPGTTSPLFGRDELVASITTQVTSPTVRLLTLTGPGGVGKTRLALAVAERLVGAFRDGVHVLNLAAELDAALVPIAIARALNIRGSADDRGWAMARDRHCLLVLDNFEHLVAAAPGLVEVLTRCPDVTMLVTSRQSLLVTGEHEFPVPELATPPDDAERDLPALAEVDTVRLFVERAVAVAPSFRLTAANAAAVAQITRALDGLPLAIGLAAARIGQLSPEEIADRLESSTDLLRGGSPDRPPHQRSLRETIAWSYQLLEPVDQRAFCQLAVFGGGFRAPAAAYVCGVSDRLPHPEDPFESDRADIAILDTCRSLVDNSLIGATTDDDGEARFAMLQTIRTFALDELRQGQDWEETARRHAAWYLANAQVAEAAMGGPSQGIWLDRLETELANLRLALDWYHGRGEYSSLAAMCRFLGTFWLLRGHIAEGSRWIGTVLANDRALDTDPTTAMDLTCLAGWLAIRRGRLEEARRWAEASLAVAYDTGSPPPQVGAALRLLADIEDRSTNYANAGSLLREALAAYREAGDQSGIADALTGLGGISLDLGDYDEAERCFREAIALTSVAGDTGTLARVIDALSVTLHVRGDTEDARDCAEQALAIFREHGDVRGIAVATDHIGKCSRDLGDLDRAWRSHRESLAWRRKFGDPRGMAVWLEAMAGVLASCRSYEAVATVLGGVAAFREQAGIPRHHHEGVQLAPVERESRKRLSAVAFARAWARGAQLSLAEIVDTAVAVAERAMTAMTAEGVLAAHTSTAPGVPGQKSAPSTSFGLTAREMEIVGLLAQQLTDSAIAERLAISPRTVNSHVSRIFMKLGVNNRREVVRLVQAGEIVVPGS